MRKKKERKIQPVVVVTCPCCNKMLYTYNYGEPWTAEDVGGEV